MEAPVDREDAVRTQAGIATLSPIDRFRETLRLRLGPTRFATWFDGGSAAVAIRLADSADGPPRIRLACPSAFEQLLLRRQFQADADAAAAAVLGPGARCLFTVADAEQPVDGVPEAVPASGPTSASIASSAPPASPVPVGAPRSPQPLQPVADPLADWVSGEASAPAERVVRRLVGGQPTASLVLLWGPSGCGKSHLLRAIAQGTRARRQRRRVLSITAEAFLRDFVEAARGGGFPSFRQKHLGVDLLLVDDVQQLVGKVRTLEEFRHVIDGAINAGGQVVLTADRGPAELRELGPELASRLAGGLSVETPLPTATTRAKLVSHAAQQLDLDLPADVAQMLGARLLGGAREAQGAVHRLALLRETFDLPLDERLALRVADDANRLSSPPVRLGDIQRAVCEVFGIDARTLRSDKRTKAVTEPRMLAMWLSRRLTGSAWSEIGDFFGRRSHSTVIAAHRRVEKILCSASAPRLGGGELGEKIRRIEAALRTA